MQVSKRIYLLFKTSYFSYFYIILKNIFLTSISNMYIEGTVDFSIVNFRTPI